MSDLTVAWITEPARNGVDAQTRVLNEHMDIQPIVATELPMNAPATIDADGLLWPTESMPLRETLFEIDPDVTVFHSLNPSARQTLPRILPYSAVAIRLGINIRAAMLAGRYQHVPEYLECFTLADHCIASGTHASSTLRALGIDSDHVTEIPSAIDTSALREPPDRARETIGTIGRVDRTKNPWLAVEAAAAVREIDPDVQPRVLLAGEEGDPSIDVIRNATGTLGLLDTVQYMGYAPDPMSQFYPNLGVHVLPSWTENCPQTVLEAAVAGVPTVAADMAWARDFPGVVTCELDDPMEWARAIYSLLTNDAMRKARVDEMQDHLHKFSTAAVTEQYEELFEELLDGPGRAKIPTEVVA